MQLVSKLGICLCSLYMKITPASFRTLDTFYFSSSKTPFFAASPPNKVTDCGELTIQLQHVLVVGYLLQSGMSLFAVEGCVVLLARPPSRWWLHLCGPVSCQLEPPLTCVAPAASDTQHAAKNGQREADRRSPGSQSTQLSTMQGRNRETPHLNWANVTFRSTWRGAGWPASLATTGGHLMGILKKLNPNYFTSYD